jgi:LmbE family N-acetylglucosaminyl deacetylase
MKNNSLLPQVLLPVLLFLAINNAYSQSSSDIYSRIKKLEETTTVLYIAAHPDDENTRLITWMSKEKRFRTAYISLTRGDGGQNLIGAELGVDLGLIRTRELMAARAIDGGEQYFTRAYDFGYSKTSEETITLWNREKILEDMVYVIRKIKPDVMICRFPPDQRAGHGHHSSSALLAKEAFDMAADPSKFPQQVTSLGSWQVKRLYWNTFKFGGNNTTSEQQLKIDVGSYNPLLGKSYGELSAESRSQHKSQGFGVPSQRGTQIEYFSPVAGDTNVTDVFKNDNFWASQKDGNEIIQLINSTLTAFDFKKPSSSIPSLINLRKIISQLPDHSIKNQKLKELDLIISDCLGLWKSAYSFSEKYAINDTLHVNLQMVVREYDSVTVRLLRNQYNDSSSTFSLVNQTMQNKAIILKGPSATTQPYWLQTTPDKGTFKIPDILLTGQAWNPEPIILQAEIVLKDSRIPIEIPVTYKVTDPVKGESIKPLVIAPLLTGRLSENTSIYNNLSKRKYKLKLKYEGSQSEQIKLYTDITGDKGWKINITDTLLSFSLKGEEKEIDFFIQPTEKTLQDAALSFRFQMKNATTEQLKSSKEITYDHIPPITWFPELKTTLKFADIKTNATKILYIKGAGDDVAVMLKQIGIQSDEVTAEEISEINLDQYDAIVTGIRAYNTDKNLPSVFSKIMAYVEKGGTFLVQYNTNSNLHPASIMTPYPYTISRNRVTEEEAVVTLTDENHPLLNHPNKITSKDFEGWVQERGLYFATKIDSAFTNILLMNDKGEQPQEGSLIVTKYGKGTYIYTGLSFFRQLPAGVPGAFRLFANLIGQKPSNDKK